MTRGDFDYKPRSHKPKPATPPKPEKPTAMRKPKTTFESYSKPSGPNIRTGNSGPDYKVKEYDYKGDYKPHKTTPNKNVDTLQGNPHVNYMDRKTEPYKGNVDYKLTENNNVGMRHWSNGFVDDTISAKADPKDKAQYPQRKYIVPPKKLVPVVAPIPTKKTFATSSTQHEAVKSKTMQTQTETQKAKTLGTQYEGSKTKTFGTQSEPTKVTSTNVQTDTPLPAPVVAPMTMSEQKPPTKSTGIQCEEPKKKTIGTATQYKGPKTKVIETQTSPVPAQTPKRRPSPVVERAVPVHTANKTPPSVRRDTPAYIRREPTPPYVQQSPPRQQYSPEMAPLVAAPIVHQRRPPTPPQRTAETPPYRRTPTPQHDRTPTPSSYHYNRTPTPTYKYNRTPTPPYHETPPYRETHPPPQPMPAYWETHPPPQTPPHRQTHTPPQHTPPQREGPSTARRSEADSRWTPEPTPRTEPQKRVSPIAQRQPEPRSYTETPMYKPKAPQKTGPIGITPQNWNQWPPHAPKNKLPPEINFCIEAYNSAHATDVS